MTRRYPDIDINRHVKLGNLLKDATAELVDIMDNSNANELIVQRASNAVVALHRLKIALEHDLITMVGTELDPRVIAERVYYGDERFEFACDLDAVEPDAFANWREVFRP